MGGESPRYRRQLKTTTIIRELHLERKYQMAQTITETKRSSSDGSINGPIANGSISAFGKARSTVKGRR